MRTEPGDGRNKTGVFFHAGADFSGLTCATLSSRNRPHLPTSEDVFTSAGAKPPNGSFFAIRSGG